jgi:hypothetical protein
MSFLGIGVLRVVRNEALGGAEVDVCDPRELQRGTALGARVVDLG